MIATVSLRLLHPIFQWVLGTILYMGRSAVVTLSQSWPVSGFQADGDRLEEALGEGRLERVDVDRGVDRVLGSANGPSARFG